MKTNVERKTLLTVFGVVMSALIVAFMVNLVMDPTGAQTNAFFRLGAPFSDFFICLIIGAEKDPYFCSAINTADLNYLPLTYLLLYPFACLDDFSESAVWNSSAVGMISCMIFIIISSAIFYFSLYKLGKSTKTTLLILPLLFFSTTSLFAMERANVVLLSSGLIAAFLFLYNSPRKEERGLALVCLSVAAVLKIFPVLFGLLLLFDKRYKAIGFCVVLGLALTFLPFLFSHHGFFENIEKYVSNLQSSAVFYSGAMGSHFGLPSLIKHAAFTQHINLPDILLTAATYLQLLLVAISIICCFLSKNTWLKISLLTAIVISVPNSSMAYCGMYFFPSIVLFFNKQVYTKKDFLYVFLFCLFLNPFQICINSGWSINYTLSNIAILSIWGLLLIDILKEVKPQLLIATAHRER